MKHIAAIVLALMASPATAAPLTYAQALTCLPMPLGPGSWPSFRSNPLGDVEWHWCPDGKGGWTNIVLAVPGGFTKAGMAVARKILTSGDPLPAARAAAAKQLTIPIDDPRLTPIWHPYRAEMQASKPN